MTDSALYGAKRTGRARVVPSGEDDWKMARSGRLAAALFSSFLIVVIACGGRPSEQAEPGGPAPPAATGIITFGSVSLNPAREHEVFRPFVGHVASRLNEVGIGRGRVVVVDSASKMVEELINGRVDVYIDSPFPVGFVWKRADIDLLLRRWKRGSETYRSVVFARADSGVESVADLAGKMIAFGEPFSTSGFLMPKAALSSTGLRLDNYEDAAVSVPPDRVGYVFSNDAENTLFWVLKGKVDVGAVNEDYYRDLAGSRISELKIVLTTEAVPRNIVCVRQSLDPLVTDALRKALLGMDEDEEGRAVLKGFEETAKFDLCQGSPERQLAGIMDLMQYVEEDVGQ
jgi:phosphonate transport system substrate-binding protein